MKSFRILWKVSEYYGKFSDNLQSFGTSWKVFWHPGKYIFTISVSTCVRACRIVCASVKGSHTGYCRYWWLSLFLHFALSTGPWLLCVVQFLYLWTLCLAWQLSSFLSFGLIHFYDTWNVQEPWRSLPALFGSSWHGSFDWSAPEFWFRVV